MIYVSLKGRLCNQMFQIATAKALSIDNNDNFTCSDYVLGITPTNKETTFYRNTILKDIKFQNFYINHSCVHNEPVDFSYEKIQYIDNICLTGYYQSEKYFKHRREEIKSLFKCPEQSLLFIEDNYSKLLNREDTCSVHIRRGDYLKYKDHHHNLTKKYYEACFQLNQNKHLVFFSDDIEWCKKTFNNVDATFIENGSDIEQLFLMSMMRSNIIANSSFSWWGAWFNNHDNKQVFAPKRWFGVKNSNLSTKDIIPQDWELIDE